MTIAVNITKESEYTGEKSIKEPKGKDNKIITDYLKKHFNEEAVWNKQENTVYLCNNDILATNEFISLMKKYKFFIQVSLF